MEEPLEPEVSALCVPAATPLRDTEKINTLETRAGLQLRGGETLAR
jgi:hypothetical protein